MIRTADEEIERLNARVVQFARGAADELSEKRQPSLLLFRGRKGIFRIVLCKDLELVHGGLLCQKVGRGGSPIGAVVGYRLDLKIFIIARYTEVQRIGANITHLLANYHPNMLSSRSETVGFQSREIPHESRRLSLHRQRR